MKSNDMGEAGRTLFEVLVGIVIIALIQCLVGVFISGDLSSFILGTVLGAGAAAFFYLHLYYALDKALDKPESEAIKYSKKQTVIRLILMGAVLAIAFTFYDQVSVVMTFVGMMNVKFAAYLQPITHQCINYLIKKGR